MKLKLALLLGFTLLLSVRAQEGRFFRVTGPVATTITEWSADGYVTWTNAPTNATFTVQTATALLGPNNWVDYIQVPITNAVTTHRLYDPNPPPGMALIPAGSFTMGNCMATNEGTSAELPLHSVYVSAFYMDKYEVTKALWDDAYNWAITHSYSFTNAGGGPYTNYPVNTISWYDAVKWCNARAEKEGLTPCYYTDSSQSSVYRSGSLNLSNAVVKWTANGYRLPTEAEWEKAARGGLKGRRFPWGDTITHSNANYYARPGTYTYDVNPTFGPPSNYAMYLRPVGDFPANCYGIYDLSGNVEEWVWDRFETAYYANPSATQDDPRGPIASPNGTSRGLRGGDFSNYSNAIYARCAARHGTGPDYAGIWVGFRCARGFNP